MRSLMNKMQAFTTMLNSCRYTKFEIMYDNIVLKWIQEENPEVCFIEQVPSCLSGVCWHKDENSEYCTGMLGVFHVYVNREVVKLHKGSLCKFWKGNNCDTLTLEEVKEALLSIEARLGLLIENAIVGRIDFSTNLEMNNPPSVYFSLLGTCPRKKRLEQENGVYFRNKVSDFLFYGKVEEYRDKGYVLPEKYWGKNLLRIELRFEKRIAAQLKMKEIHANDLYDPRFFLRLLDHWYSSYKSVIKVYKGGDLVGKTTKSLIETLASIGVLGLGLDHVLKNIDWNYKSGKISKVEASRQRGRVKKLVEKNRDFLNSNNELINELDSKVDEVVAYYRKSLDNEKLKI